MDDRQAATECKHRREIDDRLAAYRHRTFVGRDRPRGDPYERGFAGAILTEERVISPGRTEKLTPLSAVTPGYCARSP